MKIVSLSGRRNFHFIKTAAAIGIFDGVHRGHQYLIEQMVRAARRLGARPIVITFFPHPAHVLRPGIKLQYLTSLEERFELLKNLGVAVCVVVPFDRRFAKIQPEAFIKNVLVNQLKVKALFVGEDFRFGKDRSGDVALFERLAHECGYEMHAVPALKEGGQAISSTRIRALITEGRLLKVERLLGRSASVPGKVVKGAGRGRGLGFPTANVAYETDILPPNGVYAVKILMGKKEYPGVANLGTRPSFDQGLQLHLEVHIFNFSKNIYGRKVQVRFLKKIRNEKKFSNPQQLIKQIQKDVAVSCKFFK